MNMKKIFISFVFILLCATLLFSKSIKLGYNANTGDADMDLKLGKINIEAKANLKDFKAELKASYNVPGTKIDLMINKDNMQPADVYMAVVLADIANKPIDGVVVMYKKNKGKGWGRIAKELGIKPGSKAFQALKGKVKNKGKDKGKEKKKGGGKKNKKG